MRKCTNIFPIYDEVASYTVYDFAPDPSNIWGKFLFLFLSVLHVRFAVEVFHVILLSYYQQRDSERSKAQGVFVLAILRGGM